mmetsp:Transcript_30494/g.49329  ORF Transcript_30494/g.49329 Transcript_30494/m.49329 type:complete len:185 (-) Transcript_30494:790-1344(-)
MDRPFRQKAKTKDVLRIKIISMGDGACGKSCLIKRYCEEKFVTKYISTIGVDFGVKSVTINNQEIKVNFWDLAGHAEFFEVRNEFYRDSQGAILVFDVASRKSFEELENWLKEAVKFGAKDVVAVVAANKIDLKKRAVTEKEGRAWAASKGYQYFETSANTGDNVNTMFQNLFTAVVERITGKR